MRTTSRVPGWVWVAVWMGGLVVVGFGARLLSIAVDDYLSANPDFYGDFYHIPVPSPTESEQANLAAFLLLMGAAAVLVSSLMRMRTTTGRLLLLRLLGALSLIPIAMSLGHAAIQGYFQMYVDTLCGDCGPPAPNSPPFEAFAVGVAALALGVLGSLALSLVLAAFAIRGFVRAQRPGQSTDPLYPGDRSGV